MRFSRRAAAVCLIGTTLALQAQQSWDSWREAIRDVFDRDQNHLLPALRAKTWSIFHPAPGVLAERVTYNTADGMIVPAVLYRPDPKLLKPGQKLPAIVVVNGHGSDKFGWYAFYSGMMFAKAGAVVLTYDPIGEGERNEQRASMLNPSPHERGAPQGTSAEEWGRRVSAAMQGDLDQALRYVASLSEVDTRRIGVVGYSMGSFVTGIAGARLRDFDPAHPGAPHFHALILSAGGVFDDDEGYFDRNKSLCQGPAYRALKPLLTGEGKPGRGFAIFALNTQRGPTLLMNGLGDTVMDIPHHDAMWFETMHARLLAAPLDGAAKSNIFTSIMYPDSVSHRPSWVNRDGVKWLNAQLHFAFWNTDAIIDQQGTTHVSEWITANHVAISPNYFREDREGGLVAVGTGFPGLSREQLTVLPDAEWHRRESQLTYESWVAKTAPPNNAPKAAVHLH